jgi:hypothetical protein
MRRTRSDRSSVPKMETFEGDAAKWGSFYFSFKQACRGHKGFQKERRDCLLRCLRGKAVEYLRSRPKEVCRDYKKLVKDLKRRYGNVEEVSSLRRELQIIRQIEDEPLEDFGDRVYAVTLKAYPGFTERQSQSLATDAFLRGCRDKQAVILVMEKNPANILSAVRFMRASVQNLKVTGRSFQARQVKSTGPVCFATDK